MCEVEKFYDGCVIDEWKRLERQKTEFYITLRVLKEYLPNPPAEILDLGGGTGRYSIELAKQGYLVTLQDLSNENLKFAKNKAESTGISIKNFVHGNATDLNNFFEGKKFDSILIMGPLYHLTNLSDRKQVVKEALRILEPNGYVFASFGTRYVIVRDLAKNAPKWLSENYDYIMKMISTGIFNHPKYFVNSYFYTPDEIIQFMENEGIKTEDLVNCEGLVAGLEDKINELEYKDWEKWGELNYQIRRDKSLFGAAYHLLYVGIKKGF